MGDETRVQMMEVKKGAEAIGNVVERYMIRFLGPVGRRIAAASKAGRVMALLGVVAIIAGAIFIYTTDTLVFWKTLKKGQEFINVRYEMKGYGIMLFAGIALYFIGIAQKKR